MKTKVISAASDFLGSSETRYFSNGYKHIYYSLLHTVISNGLLKTMLKVDFDKCRLSSVNHLGAIEYVAIACNLCEQLIKKEYNLTNAEVAESWICSCRLKIRKSLCVEIDKQTEVCAKIVTVSESGVSVNNYISKLEVIIGDAIVQIEVNHPIKLWIGMFSFECDDESSSNLYLEGYKQRTHQLTDIYVDPEKKKCNASAKIIKKPTLSYGIGAKYETTLLSDVINISGQLSQILLYTLEGITRQEANNMWLREFSISCSIPFIKLDYPVEILFDRFEQIKIYGEDWRSVHLTSYLGDVKANFKITHKIQKNK